jgi:hypothetical protein
MLGISLYSYLYSKLAKMVSFLLTLVFSSTKLEKGAEQVLSGSGAGGGSGPSNVYICE